MIWSGKSRYENLDAAFQDSEAGLGQIVVKRVLSVESSASRKHSEKRSKPKKTPARRRKGPPEVPLITQVSKLDAVVEAIRGKENVQVTRLTVVKKLCENPKAARAFALFFAQQARGRLNEKLAYVWGGRDLRAVAPRSDSANFPGFFSILCSVFRDSVVTIFRVIS